MAGDAASVQPNILDGAPALEVRMLDGRTFRVYPDGRIDGFPEGAKFIINRIPLIQRGAR